jgi:hypothetical protein
MRCAWSRRSVHGSSEGSAGSDPVFGIQGVARAVARVGSGAGVGPGCELTATFGIRDVAVASPPRRANDERARLLADAGDGGGLVAGLRSPGARGRHGLLRVMSRDVAAWVLRHETSCALRQLAPVFGLNHPDGTRNLIRRVDRALVRSLEVLRDIDSIRQALLKTENRT